MFPTPMIPIRTRSIWLSLPRASLHGRCCAKTGGYGVFALMSSDTRIDSNRAEGNAEAGFYVGDSPRANAGRKRFAPRVRDPYRWAMQLAPTDRTRHRRLAERGSFDIELIN